MIVLDTNVLSEPLRTRPDPQVMAWLNSLHPDVALVSITVGEILLGARLLPEGRRRESLMAAIDTTLTTFADNVLPYDQSAARVYAEMQQTRRSAGVPLSVEDGMIAAVCRHNAADLATRNTKDFEGLGLALINPWDYAS